VTEKFETVRLRILGENHTIACEPEDRELLKKAAPLLDEHIEAVQQQDPLLDTASVFMLASLGCPPERRLNRSKRIAAGNAGSAPSTQDHEATICPLMTCAPPCARRAKT